MYVCKVLHLIIYYICFCACTYVICVCPCICVCVYICMHGYMCVVCVHLVISNQNKSDEVSSHKENSNVKTPSGFESPFPLRKRSPSVTERTGSKFTSGSTPHIDDDLQKILRKRLSRELDPNALEKTEFAIAQSKKQDKPTVLVS